MKIKKIFLVAFMMFIGISAAFATEKQTDILNEKPMAALPAGITDFALGESNGAMLLAGGKVDGNVSSKIYILNKGAEEWKSAGLKKGFANAAFTSDGKSLFIVSGTDVHQLSLDKKGELQETALTSLPKAIPGAGIAVCEGKLYLLGGNEFMSLSLKGGEWKQEAKCPIEGTITDPCLVSQRAVTKYQVVLLSAKVNGKPSKEAWAFRPLATDGVNGPVKDMGWNKIAESPQVFTPNTAVKSGQAHVIVYKNGKPYVYHLVTDTWVTDTEMVNKTENALAVQMGGGAFVVPTQTEMKATYADFSTCQHPLALLDYVIIAIYFIILLWVGIYFAKKEKTSEDFFMGGHKIPWWAAGISIYATGTSAISYMAIPAMHYGANWVMTFAPTVVGVPIAIFVTAKYMIPIIRSLRVTTSFEYLKVRFNNSLRLLGSFFCIAFQLGGRMSVVLLLPAIAISAVTGMNVMMCVVIMGVLATVYTTMGGISAVIWTDVIQVVVLIGGALLALILLISGTEGGFAGFIQLNMDYNKFHAIDWSLNLKGPVIWIFLITAIVNTAGILNDQVQVQRALATPTVKEARKSVIIMNLIVLPGNLLFALFGFALFAYFKSNPALLSPAVTNDQIVPYYIVQGLPVGVTGLILAGLFAASMSSLDSSMSSVSTMIVSDFYKTFKKDATDVQCLKLGKWLTAIIGILGTVIAMVMSQMDIGSIFNIWNKMLALLGGGFVGVFLLGMFCNRATVYGAWAGAIASVAATWYIQGAGLAVNAMVYTPFSIVTCIVVGYLVSLVTPKGKNQHTEGLTVYTINYKEVENMG